MAVIDRWLLSFQRGILASASCAASLLFFRSPPSPVSSGCVSPCSLGLSFPSLVTLADRERKQEARGRLEEMINPASLPDSLEAERRREREEQEARGKAVERESERPCACWLSCSSFPLACLHTDRLPVHAKTERGSQRDSRTRSAGSLVPPVA